MSVFSSYSIRGAVRVGPIVVNPDLRVWGQAVVAVLDLLSRRFGLGLPQLGRVRTPPMHEDLELTEMERAYLARVAGPRADAIMCDYGTMTAAVAAVGRPDAPSAVIMHELFSSRDPSLDPAQEARMLARADVVVTIQDNEAASIRRHAPQAALMSAPMAVEAVAAPQPGKDDTLLFVASQTPANIEGLDWFAREVWPILRRRRPGLTLDVAGTIARGMGPMPDGIRLLGLVPDLAPLYASAGVVVSPLRSGTGLKIKLVEAMAAGKCIVGTSVTSQGVEQLVAGAMRIEDDAEGFAKAVLALAADAGERRRLGTASLALARARFSPDGCYDEVLRFLLQGRPRAQAGAEQRAQGLGNASATDVTKALQGRGRDVLIVIPTLDEARHIGSVVAALQADEACSEALIVVSDGGSRDATVSVVGEIGHTDPRVRVIVTPGAAGKGPAINVNAAVRAFGQGRRWLVRVDAHAEYPPCYASGLVRAALRTGATSVVTPLRTTGQTCFQRAAAAAQNSLLGTGGAAHRYGKSVEARWVDHGHHALIDLAHFAAAGGYDETFSHNEDAELDYRLTKAGGRIWLATDLPVGYFPRRTLKSLFVQYFRYGVGRARNHARHKGRLRLRQYVPIMVAPLVCLALFAWINPTFASPAFAWVAVCLLLGFVVGQKDGACGAVAGVPAMAMHLGWSLGYWSQVLRPTPDRGAPQALVVAPVVETRHEAIM